MPGFAGEKTRAGAVLIAVAAWACACAPHGHVAGRAPRADAGVARPGAADGVRGGGSGTDARAVAISDEVLASALELVPERAALLRLPGARHDALPDESPEGIAAREAREDGWRAELASMNVASLAPAPRLAHALAMEVLEARRAARVCRYELWSVSQFVNGWQVRFTNLAAAQPVGTPELRAQALTRWARIPTWVDVHIAQLRRGLAGGRVASDVTVAHTLEQVDKLIAAPPAASPFAQPAMRDPDPAFRAAIEQHVAGDLHAALVRYRAFLADEVRPRARTRHGIDALPDGAACYRAMLRQFTTLPDRTPEQVHAEGNAQLAALMGEMERLSATHFGGLPPRVLFERFRTDPAYLHASKAEITAQATAAYQRGQAALPRAFGVLPRAPMSIEPIPAFQEKTMAAHYLVPALDGSRPGTYRIRLYEAEKESRVQGESTAFHEGVPGHHLQLTLAVERKENPPIARFSWSSAFGEGWALYAERLAGELDLFTSPADRFGMLAAFSFRAVRLIVDTGLHALGWSRARAVDELLAHTPMTRTQAEAEVDRYIAFPGQATSYMTGYLYLRDLRREAEARLGSAFDLRRFHDEVLASGSAPLPVVGERVRGWVARQGRERDRR